METPQRDNLKQILLGAMAVFIGWMLIVWVMLPAMSSLSASVAWLSISVTERRVMIFGSAALLIAGGFVLIRLAMRSRTQQRTYHLITLITLGFGSALTLAGLLLLSYATVQQ